MIAFLPDAGVYRSYRSHFPGKTPQQLEWLELDA